MEPREDQTADDDKANKQSLMIILEITRSTLIIAKEIFTPKTSLYADKLRKPQSLMISSWK